jgi:hypothetical protein
MSNEDRYNSHQHYERKESATSEIFGEIPIVGELFESLVKQRLERKEQKNCFAAVLH